MTLPAILITGLMATVVFAVALAGVAAADVPAATCPDAPTGTTDDGDVHELRALRSENAQTCAAIVASLDRLAGRVQGAGGDVSGAVQALRDGQVGRDADHPSYTTGATGTTGAQTVQLTDADRDAVSTFGNGLGYWLRFIVGAGLIGLAAPHVLRTWGITR